MINIIIQSMLYHSRALENFEFEYRQNNKNQLETSAFPAYHEKSVYCARTKQFQSEDLSKVKKHLITP